MPKNLIEKTLRYALAALGIWPVAVYLYISLARMRFPFQLEWIEGNMVDETIRFLRHLPVYVKPSIDFIPQIYPPLYFYLSSLLMRVTGEGFLPLRLVSWAASLGFLLIIFRWVQKETGRVEFAWLAAALMAACYKASGSWYDVARVDSLFVFFLVAAAYRIRFSETIAGWLTAGVLIVLCWLTKQTAVAAFLPLFLYCLFTRPLKAAWIFIPAALLGAGVFLRLNSFSGGWYGYYIIDFARYFTTGFTRIRFIHFWTRDLMGVLPWACLFSLFYLAGLRDPKTRLTRLFYAAFIAGAVLTSCPARVHWGGSENVLMPVYASLCILFGISVFDISNALPADKRFWLRQMLWGVCIFQLTSLFFTPGLRIPKKADYESGKKLLSAMQAVQGDLYAPRFGYLPTLVGKHSYAHSSVVDIVIYYDPINGPALLDEITEAIRHKRFEGIIYESDIFRWTILENYNPGRSILIKDSKFWARDDSPFVYEPKRV